MFPDNNRYKETVLGSMPSDWKIEELGNHYEIQQGKALSKEHRKGKSPSFFLRTANVLWGKLDLTVLDQMDFTGNERDKLSLKKGDLLICEGGDIGRTAIWNEEVTDCYYQNHVFRVRSISEEVYSLFHMYWMDAGIRLLGQYRGYGNKTTIPNLSKRRLSSFPIPIPPLPEQRAIAQVLSTVRQAIEATERVIAAARELKRSMMKHLFTYGPVPVDKADQVVLKDTELGEVPEGWEMVKVGDLAKIIRGASPRPKGDPRYYGGNVPRLMVADVTRDFMYVTPRIDFLTEDGAKLSRPMKKGSLVIQVSGNPGTPAILAVDACIHDGFAGLVDLRTDKINIEFLFHYLHIMKDVHKRLAFGAVFQNLQTYAIRDFLVPLPPITMQEGIARSLAKVDKKIRGETQQKTALEALFNSLLHHLMTGKVRVNTLIPGPSPSKGEGSGSSPQRGEAR